MSGYFRCRQTVLVPMLPMPLYFCFRRLLLYVVVVAPVAGLLRGTAPEREHVRSCYDNIMRGTLCDVIYGEPLSTQKHLEKVPTFFTRLIHVLAFGKI